MRPLPRRKALAIHVACALAVAGSFAARDAHARVTTITIASATSAYGGVAEGTFPFANQRPIDDSTGRRQSSTMA